MEITVVTGMSGAGKSCAFNCFEDLGYYCIDNLPPALIGNVLDLLAQGKRAVEQAVFVIDIRGGDFFDDLKSSLLALKNAGRPYRILFLDASDEVLLRRFNETRRSHPLSKGGGSNRDGVALERKRLLDIKRAADVVIDTSHMKTAALAGEIKKLFIPGEENVFKVHIMSFGYKFGIPAEADIVFDMRFIPNPFYVPSLKELSGNNKRVRDYVMKAPVSKAFRDSALRLIGELIPHFSQEGKYRLNLAFGCTGGRHRSVTMAIVFADALAEMGCRITLAHRDL
ncbi:MAG: RNase adapter RapZ [Clostridiales Family XIII bacterium]|jgi:UPF0042 nucleotide-binding protein|nr:RNase adapter RapZ [Clostridiales Family XIII bacterium]